MTGAMLLQTWADTLVTTAVLVFAVLAVRKPFARHFGPRLTYALWAIPALRLVLPPLPFAQPEAAAAAGTSADVVMIDIADAAATVGSPAAAPAMTWTLADALPLFFALWLAGTVAVLVRALAAHRRFQADVLAQGIALESIGGIRLIMTEAVDGPVAFGLLRRYVAVPRDFFARYAADERALAIDHELAHHRHGDLWANGAALLLLAAQWFNPLAWRAIRAFRFDQEAACDARVLTMAATDQRAVRTARYATAIAKAAVGARLSLAAPMAVHDNLQERLTMLTRQDISAQRGLIGRLLVGGATLAVLATTATLVPAGIASATAQPADAAAPPAPPADSPEPVPAAPEAVQREQRVMIFTSENEGADAADAAAGDAKREVRRIVIRDGEVVDGDGKVAIWAPGAAAPKARRFELRMPGALARDDIMSTLAEQGVTGAQAEAIADKLEAKRKQQFAFAPLPPMPPMPPLPPAAWSAMKGKSVAIANCADGAKAVPLFDSTSGAEGTRSHVVMMRCGAKDKAAHLSALKKARERFVEGRWSQTMSDDIRAKVAADLDKAIADLEKSGD
ncbi:MAG: peptidase M56, BlaR1 [Sphingopyxis sp.]|uniref:M56 family metallopeptidase n=1 Tax=Sphingopyxis sp. TaxID=1908224 RepID=UPI003D80DB3E